MRRNIFLLFFSVLLLLTGCKTKQLPDEYNYLQNVEEIATEASVRTSVSTIQKGDQLVIHVTAKNMDVVKAFNQGYFGSQNAISTSPTPSSAGAERAYMVDADGNIDFPVIGLVNTTNKTLESLKSELRDKVTVYIKDPILIVRLANFKITVLGEVARPGQYSMSEINPTLLNALGLAGDITMYGKRDNLLIVRNINGILSKERINLLNSSFVNSEFYQLKQGDVIYVSATETKEKIARQSPNTSIYIAVAGTIIGLAGIFITIFKK